MVDSMITSTLQLILVVYVKYKYNIFLVLQVSGWLVVGYWLLVGCLVGMWSFVDGQLVAGFRKTSSVIRWLSLSINCHVLGQLTNWLK